MQTASRGCQQLEMSECNTLEFQDVCYSVILKTGQDAGSTKKILHHVSAKCVSGRLTALMGPSGAGKSSLVGSAWHVRPSAALGRGLCQQFRRSGPVQHCSRCSACAQQPAVQGQYSMADKCKIEPWASSRQLTSPPGQMTSCRSVSVLQSLLLWPNLAHSWTAVRAVLTPCRWYIQA